MQSLSDHALFVKKDSDRKLAGMTGTYVDDSLQAGTTEFEALADTTAQKVDSRHKEFINFLCAGVYVKSFALYSRTASEPAFCKAFKVGPARLLNDLPIQAHEDSLDCAHPS